MAEVTGFTADRMLEIENTTVVDGEVDGSGNLILLMRDGTPINAGLVKGADGVDGDDGANGPVASLGAVPPSSPAVGQLFYDTNNLTGLTDLMAAKNPTTSTANWAAWAYGYDTGITFAVAGGGVTCTWTTTGNHFAGILLSSLSPGQSYLIRAKVRVPAGSPDIQLTVGYKTSSQVVRLKDVDVTVMLSYVADTADLAFGIECGGATGSVVVKEFTVYAVNQKGFPEYYWDGSSWVQTEHVAAKADIYSRVNTYGNQTIAGVKNFTDDVQIDAVSVLAPSTDTGNRAIAGTDGHIQVPAAVAPKMTKFDTVGSTTWTRPVGLKAVRVTVVGGGAAGGSAPANTAGSSSGGGGGGGGGWAIGIIRATDLGVAEGATIAITVGAGGTAVANAGGNGGGDSSFGTLITADGGNGGGASTSSTAPGLVNGGLGGTAGGTATNLFTSAGGPGRGGFRITATTFFAGNGGNSYGAGGREAGSAASGANGVSGAGYGGGGGGASASGTNGAFTGGLGIKGCVIVEEFYD